jgi:hypothetical protein
MAKTLMLALALLLSTAWLQAQNQPAQDQPSQSQPRQATPQDQAAAPTSVEGCLRNSGGTFVLTDDAGNTYQLQGDTSKLSEHVGHEVRITGTTSGSSGATGSDMSGNSQSQPTFTVQRLKHISKTCNNDKGASK